MNVLAIDVGTSSVKAAVLHAESATVAGKISRATYAIDHPVPAACEVPVSRVWGAVVEAVRGLQGEPLLEKIDGLGLSCLTPALVLLDDKDEAIRPAWLHLDRRALPAAQAVSRSVGAEFLSTTGNPPLPGGMSALCLRQILADTPEIASRIRSYLHLNGWIALQLSGKKAFDPANASFTGLFSTVGDRQWSARWLSFFGARREWLPEVVSGDTTLGGLVPAAASALGVKAGIPVKLGTADTTSAMCAADIREGELLHVIGTTQVLATPVAVPIPAPRRLVRCRGVGDGFLHVTHNPVGGAALDWAHQLCFADESSTQFYEETVPLAAVRTTPVELDPPFLGGDRLELEARDAGLRHLSLATHRLDVLSAVLRAMERHHLEAVRALGVGERFTRICLTGRAAPAIVSLLASGTQVERLEEGSLRGVARLFAARAPQR